MARLFRRILVPYDFSAQATHVLKVAGDLARSHRGRLAVVHAIVPFYAVPGFPPAEQAAWVPPADLVADTRRRLQKLVERTLGRRGPRATARVVIGDPLRVILDAAKGADSIVMATVGRTGLAHLLIGSTAEKVLRHSPIPVLTIRATAARRTAARTRTPAKRRRRA